MANGKINAENGWASLTHAFAKVTPFYLTHTGRIRKSVRALSQKRR